ncbi:MAG: hypothetical protein ILP10_05515 [Lachnospiraceae bacterium]|nr:hypothetical protein [Lachnospiraceae bacterium]
MKKKIISLFLIIVLTLSGCSSDTPAEPAELKAPAENLGEQSDKPETGEPSAEEPSAEEPVESGDETPVTRGFRMKVSGSDGKLTVNRAQAGSNTERKGGNKKTEVLKGVWTIFVYLCGTDLESVDGIATGDIEQMLASKGSDKLRFVIQTGGTSKWKNGFSSKKAERYVVQKGDIELVDSVKLTNMGDAKTLTSYLEWGLENYASEKMGLIFWDHGGGSITGVCVDENFDSDTLYLGEMNQALSSVFGNMADKFEFIGFDCCLMGTAETANILTTYARYMYGSQESEPGTGWDYKAVSDFLAGKPGADGAALGKVVADSFYEECKKERQEKDCTMTVVDLSKFDKFLVSFNDYASRLYEACQKADSLGAIVRCFESAENFGGNNKSEGYTNMVDLGGIVKACKAYADPGDVLDTLKACISYNKNGKNHKNASGLSVYYPLEVQGSEELKVFSGVAISPYYMSIVDLLATGYEDDGYSNDIFFTDDGYWDNDNCGYDYFDYDYFDYADEEDDGLSDLISFEQEPFVDDDGMYWGILDEDGLEWTSEVSAYLAFMVDDTIVELGETSEVICDWESGAITDNFDGYWFSLPDGQLLAAYIVGYSDDGETTIYTSPVYVNGKSTNLRFTVTDYEIELEGLWNGIGEGGMAARGIKKLKAGDVVVPAYYLDDDLEFKNDKYKWKKGDELTYAPLFEGDYFYCLMVWDAFGDYYDIEPVMITIDRNGDFYFTE